MCNLDKESGVNPPLTPPRRGRTESGGKKNLERFALWRSDFYTELSRVEIIGSGKN
ncbi:hypothetical protein [Okeania sp. SIO1H2]|uniref:hypothetical protein n=1 Tax=Okeania sp. SIO1H2 TaxID=2607775 RepID=UPI00141D4B4E|nr:hypothetical protein [Okeania sp. SIO1H2]NET94334.1 hypothetical protein [Okeania sp. SIO1H2]